MATTISLIITSFFVSIFLREHVNVKHYYCMIIARVKKIEFEKALFTNHKWIDCFPCFTWWCSVIVTLTFFFFTNDLNLITPLASFVLASYIKNP